MFLQGSDLEIKILSGSYHHNISCPQICVLDETTIPESPTGFAVIMLYHISILWGETSPPEAQDDGNQLLLDSNIYTPENETIETYRYQKLCFGKPAPPLKDMGRCVPCRPFHEQLS